MTREELELFAFVRDASTCGAWTRPCQRCGEDGHDAATLSIAGVVSLVRRSPGSVLFWRQDGTVATADCLRPKPAPMRLPRPETVARVTLVGVTVLALVAVLTVALFGDNLRKLYGMSSGCYVGAAEDVRPRRSVKGLDTFTPPGNAPF
ncbi:MAG: hypothetical protein JNJ54_16635 [Myxococcaceae bacterium]|nr:hypothetical protein [Myxococcaceae bacterium]